MGRVLIYYGFIYKLRLFHPNLNYELLKNLSHTPFELIAFLTTPATDRIEKKIWKFPASAWAIKISTTAIFEARFLLFRFQILLWSHQGIVFSRLGLINNATEPPLKLDNVNAFGFPSPTIPNEQMCIPYLFV